MHTSICLFTDVVLPGGMSGVELAAKAGADRPGLKVLYTSGYAPERVLDDLGYDRDSLLVRKPFDTDDLIRLVRQALDQSIGKASITPDRRHAGKDVTQPPNCLDQIRRPWIVVQLPPEFADQDIDAAIIRLPLTAGDDFQDHLT